MQKLFSNYIKCGLAGVFAAMIGMTACTRETVDPVRYNTDTTDQLIGSPTLKERKVLLIGIDGAIARLVDAYKPPVIAGLLPKSVYTFSGMNDTINTTGSTWTSLMTGFPVQSHKVVDSTLIPRSVEGSHDPIKYYNTFLYYIKEDNNRAKITSISQWADLNYFTMNVADRIVNVDPAKGDKGVADEAVKELSAADPDLVIVNFNGPAVAGKKSGFTDNPDYRQSIMDVDARIGEVIKALQARKDSAKEEWLVVIQNTTGGFQNRIGGASHFERDNMTIYYSPIITPGRVDGSAYHAAGIRYTGGAGNYIRAENNDGGLYNLSDKEMTIEAKVRFNKGPRGNYTYSYPPFLSKIDSLDGAIAGWGFYRDGTSIAFAYQDGKNANEVRPGVGISDGNWHTITATLKHTYDATNGHTYTASAFLDGTAKATTTIKKGEAKIESLAPLVIGYRPVIYNDNNEIDMYMTYLHIYNTVLPDAAILANAKAFDVDPASPYAANLIGNWVGDEESGNILYDRSSSKKNFTITGKYRWDALNLMLGTTVAPNNLDVAASILDWIGITLPATTKPPGTSWLKVIGAK
ncbi:alkaline phosphatase family protein [Chitinophaga sp. CB10]|uniref:alkaline phosphatase family protein n=1 Tax=Chitinophaga sp. CB10 TaxID=1891659 RepID=UPI0025C4B516|nr:alkaline phosphatase family protein [Chitinophaga sp. CB10]